MDSLNHVNQADVIEAFNSTSRYLDDLLNIDNPNFEGQTNPPPKLQLNIATTTETEAPFLDLHLSIANEFVSSKIYDNSDDFDFDIVNFPFLDVDLVYKLKKLKERNDFSSQFRKIITHYRRIGYNLNIMPQSACLVFNPIMVDNYDAFLNCMASDCNDPDFKLFILVGWDRSFLSVAWPNGVQLVFFFCSGASKLFGAHDLHRRAAYSICESSFLIHHGGNRDLFVCP